MRKNDGGRKSKTYCKHICKYHNVSPLQQVYANKINKQITLSQILCCSSTKWTKNYSPYKLITILSLVFMILLFSFYYGTNASFKGFVM
jgi:hypothetical protein